MSYVTDQLLHAVTHENLFAFFVVLLLFCTTYWYYATPKNLPPGPLGLPIVGYLPFMGKRPDKTITNLGKKYGSIFSMYLGSRLVVVLHGYDAIKEAFVKQADIFSGRPEPEAFSLSEDSISGVATVDGTLWRDHRRFILTLLRDYGVGKISIEPRIMEEINSFILELKTLNGKAANIKHTLATSVANNISIMTLGKRFEYRDPTFLKIQSLMEEFVTSINSVSASNFFPWLKYIPGIQFFSSNSKLEKILNTAHIYFRGLMNEHKQSFVNGQRDHYVNAYFTEQESKVEKQTDIGNFNDVTLINNMRTLFGAGTETTTSTLLWGIIYLMLNPEIQKKVQDEIDEVIGQNRIPSWNDHLLTPYTEATLCEIQRKASLAPLSLPHRNTEECYIFGYRIPQSTLIIPNLGNALSDPKLWGDPENFRPERFLSENGKVEKPEYFIPFSTGKRECLGEILARMELYLYFTTMMQKFTFQIQNGCKPSVESISITNIPAEFVTRVISRN